MDHLMALKGEQTARIVLRDTALYVFIGTIFAIHAAEHEVSSNSALLSYVKAFSVAASAIMLSIYVSNDFYVSSIGRFVTASDSSSGFVTWEMEHRRGRFYVAQKVLRSLIVLVLFGVWTAVQLFSIPTDAGLPVKLVAVLFALLGVVGLGLFLVNSWDSSASPTTA